MIKVLVSACLLGTNSKYDGTNNYNSELVKFLEDYIVIPICPEVDGGLSIPRSPAEIINNKVVNTLGIDVTNNYLQGASIALDKAISNDCKYAILKSKSPSCGSELIYDGSFTRTLTKGNGITADLLIKNGIKVFNELNYKEILKERL